jgi:hypothetical protein
MGIVPYCYKLTSCERSCDGLTASSSFRAPTKSRRMSPRNRSPTLFSRKSPRPLTTRAAANLIRRRGRRTRCSRAPIVSRPMREKRLQAGRPRMAGSLVWGLPVSTEVGMAPCPSRPIRSRRFGKVDDRVPALTLGRLLSVPFTEVDLDLDLILVDPAR